VLIKVIAASSEGELAKLGFMFNVDPPELTVASAVTVYTLSTPAIVNTSPA